jgi:hypothetical protein
MISPSLPGSRVYLPAGPMRGKFGASEDAMKQQVTQLTLFAGPQLYCRICGELMTEDRLTQDSPWGNKAGTLVGYSCEPCGWSGPVHAFPGAGDCPCLMCKERTR